MRFMNLLSALSASQLVDSIASSAICWLSAFELIKLVVHSDKWKEMERMVSAIRKDHIPPPPVKVLSLSLMMKDPKH